MHPSIPIIEETLVSIESDEYPCNLPSTNMIDTDSLQITPESLVSEEDNIDWFEKIKILKQRNPTNLTCSYLNVNSIRNKFNNLVDMIDQNIDIICLAETKLDDSFPSSNFSIPGYNTPYRFDINSKSGGLLIYIKETIPSKELKQLLIPKELQILPIEINLRKSKWLIIPVYRPPSISENNLWII